MGRLEIKRTAMRAAEARQILGLHNGYTAEDVRQAFVAAAMAQHPDAGGKGGDLDAISCARDILLQMLGGIISCPQCRGRGSIKARFGSVPCGRCEGEGTIATGASL
jgi:DnaJ-class molecular chaperone